MIHCIFNASFFKHFSSYGIFRRLAHMNSAAYRIKVILVFISSKQHVPVFYNDCSRPISEPPVFIRKSTVMFHILFPQMLISRFLFLLLQTFSYLRFIRSRNEVFLLAVQAARRFHVARGNDITGTYLIPVRPIPDRNISTVLGTWVFAHAGTYRQMRICLYLCFSKRIRPSSSGTLIPFLYVYPIFI